MLKVHAISAFSDNYIWLIQADNSNKLIIVDPTEAKPVLDFMELTGTQAVAIFITHHHVDHIHGVSSLLKQLNMPVYGPRQEHLFCVSRSVDSHSVIEPGEGFPVFSILDTPGHTAGHISFYIHQQLFCGDTLFTGGCGRLLGGTATQLFNSLQRLKALPPETEIYCSHEYTEANLRFAAEVEPMNQVLHQRIEQVRAIRASGHPSVPSLLKDELATNPFLRTNKPAIKKAAEQYSGRLLNDELAVFTALRSWKDI